MRPVNVRVGRDVPQARRIRTPLRVSVRTGRYQRIGSTACSAASGMPATTVTS